MDSSLILAASSAALGRTEKARRAARDVLKLKPEFNLKDFAGTQRYKEAEDPGRLTAQLVSARLA